MPPQLRLLNLGAPRVPGSSVSVQPCTDDIRYSVHKCRDERPVEQSFHAPRPHLSLYQNPIAAVRPSSSAITAAVSVLPLLSEVQNVRQQSTCQTNADDTTDSLQSHKTYAAAIEAARQTGDIPRRLWEGCQATCTSTAARAAGRLGLFVPACCLLVLYLVGTNRGHLACADWSTGHVAFTDERRAWLRLPRTREYISLLLAPVVIAAAAAI